MSEELIVTGRLDGWFVSELATGIYRLNGYVSGDVRGRFSDGEFIHTSAVFQADQPSSELKEGDIVKTMYSSYKLGGKFYPRATIKEYNIGKGVNEQVHRQTAT